MPPSRCRHCSRSCWWYSWRWWGEPAAFETLELRDDLAAVRARYASGATIVSTPDFETLPASRAEELGLVADALDPIAYPEEWLPADAPEPL